MKKRIGALLLAMLLCAGCAKAPDAPAETERVPSDAPAQETPADAETGYTNVTLTVRRDAETVSERAITEAAELRLVQEIVFDSMVKSAAWEGVEVSELEAYIALSFDEAGLDGRQSYYQFDTPEGRHVLQTGESGWYSIMSDEAYAMLLQLAGAEADTRITEEEAAALLSERFGERDAVTGNVFSFDGMGTMWQDGREYYRFRVSWLVDGDHLSYLTDYLVSVDGTELLEYLPEDGTGPAQ